MDYFIGNIYLDEIENFSLFCKNWNKKIKNTDLVYIIGGIIKDIKDIKLVNKLNGQKSLIFSSNDKDMVNKYDKYRNIFKEILGFKEFSYYGKTICVSYTPFLFHNIEKTVIDVYGYSLPDKEIKESIFYSKINNDNIKFVDVNINKISLPLSLDEIIKFKEPKFKKPILQNNITDKKKKNSLIKNNDKVKNKKEKESNTEITNTTSVSHAVKDSVTKTTENNTKRRGRPPKSVTAVQQNDKNNKDTGNIDTLNKKRVLKKESSKKTDLSSTKKRGRPRKDANIQKINDKIKNEPVKEVKKRGRPPKNK